MNNHPYEESLIFTFISLIVWHFLYRISMMMPSKVSPILLSWLTVVFWVCSPSTYCTISDLSLHKSVLFTFHSLLVTNHFLLFHGINILFFGSHFLLTRKSENTLSGILRS